LPDDERTDRYPIKIDNEIHYLQVLGDHQIKSLRQMFKIISDANMGGHSVKLASPVICLETGFGDPLTYRRQFMPTFSDW
jgi:hypothetical protein